MLEVSVVRAILKKLIVICLVSVITSLLSLSLIGKIHIFGPKIIEKDFDIEIVTLLDE